MGVELPAVQTQGYYRLNARLTDKTGVKTTGYDDLFAADYRTGHGIRGKGAVIVSSGVINAFLKDTRGITLEPYDSRKYDYDFIVIGTHDQNRIRSMFRNLMENVSNGATLIILNNADKWAEAMEGQSIQYWGSMRWGVRGRFFVGKSPYLQDLPVAQCMGWEYQDFYRGDVSGLHMGWRGTETIVGLAAENRGEILNALVRVPYGDGQIFLSTLNFSGELTSAKPESAVGKKLFSLKAAEKKYQRP